MGPEPLRRYSAMSLGRTGTRSIGLPTPSAWRRASRIAATIAGVTEMHGGSPTPLAPSGACGSGSSIERGHDVGHVEERRQQVVGEAGVADPAVDLDDLLHHGQPQALGDAALDLAEHRQRVERPADVLGGGDLHDLDEAELRVDVDDGAVGDEGERHVAVALTVVVELLGRAVVVLDASRRSATPADVRRRRGPAASPIESTTSVPSMTKRSGSIPWAAPTCSNSRSRTARHAASTAPPLIHVWRDADVEPAEPIWVSIGSSTTTSTPSTVRAICWAIVTKPWPTSDVANFSVATPSASWQRAVE